MLARKLCNVIYVVLFIRTSYSENSINVFYPFQQAGEFCTSHGLTVTEGCVNFSRSSFIEPEERLAVKRAWRLIESKRNCSIGQVWPVVILQTVVTNPMERFLLHCRK